MRRVLLVPLLSLGLLAGPAYAAPAPGPDRDKLPPAAAARATEALETARAAFEGKGGHEVTMALVALRKSYDGLSARQKQQADAILARPTDGADDEWEDGYTVAEATPLCSTHFCLHYVTTTVDAPSLADSSPANGVPDQVDQTLAKMEQVWTYEVGTRGYRAPATDVSSPNNGGDGKFDVYLKDVGAQGYYGYCAPEDFVAPDEDDDYRAFGFCVLDDDFAPGQFGGAPAANSLAVTAAHEFFHAVQFNYDAFEDPWIMEGTATWMEERFADYINDNRQYLSASQLARNGLSLDTFEYEGLAQYGNWIFFEFLSKNYGVDSVKELWKRMDSSVGGASDQFSTQALRSYLVNVKGTTLARFYALFAGTATISRKIYEEGAVAAYPQAPFAATYGLSSAAKSTGTKTLTLNHLTSRNYGFVPGASLTGTWRLKVVVNGPSTVTGGDGFNGVRQAGAYLIVHKKDGTRAMVNLPLNSAGDYTYYAPFSPASVSKVTLTLANAGNRVAPNSCWSDPYDTYALACFGASADNGQGFSFSGTAVR